MVDIVVREATGLSERAHLSVRVGDVCRQQQFKPGNKYHFGEGGQPRRFVLDVFEKVGSTQVKLDDLDVSDNGTRKGTVEVLRTDGTMATVGLEVAPVAATAHVVGEPAKQDYNVTKREGLRHEVAVKAKNYFSEHGLQRLLQGMVHELLDKQPCDPIQFMTSHLQNSPGQRSLRKLATSEMQALSLMDEDDELPNWSLRPGLGDEEMPGFAIDGSAPLPDLTRHCSILASVLGDDPAIYERLKAEETTMGVTFAKCIKSGIDHPGHEAVGAVGLVAGCEGCYNTFQPAFDPVIAICHEGYEKDSVHPSNVDVEQVFDIIIDPVGNCVQSVEIQLSRNLAGLRMPAACSKEERRHAERVLAQALLQTQSGTVQGEYFPLRGSRSYIPKPSGMSAHEEERLRQNGILFTEPDTTPRLAAGYGRHWPDARGIFQSSDGEFAALLNEADHVKLVARADAGDLKQVFERIFAADAELQSKLADKGYTFARTEHLGFLTSCPSQLGTGMSVRVAMSIPQVSAHIQFQGLLQALGVEAKVQTTKKGANAQSSVWTVTSKNKLGTSEAEVVNDVLEGCRIMADLEVRLEAGEELDLVEYEEEHIHKLVNDSWYAHRGVQGPPGLGDLEYPGFPTGQCPEKIPDLSSHFNLMAEALKEDPSIYERLSSASTQFGVTLAKCIKPGMDSKGHPLVRSLGLVAGDASCYEVFRELFDRCIARRHAPWDPATSIAQVSHLCPEQCSAEEWDINDDRIARVRLRVCRNLHDKRYPPACSLEDRREVERLITSACSTLPDDVNGKYYPLKGSDSYGSRPGGMSLEEEQMLKDAQFLFFEPDSELSLSKGIGRHWPDARGVFVSHDYKCHAWVNEEDHLRIVSVESGHDIHAAFARLCRLHASLQEALQKEGHQFSRNDRLGYLGSCPSNVGTCLVATMTLRLPCLRRHGGFRKLCAQLGVAMCRASSTALAHSTTLGQSGQNLELFGREPSSVERMMSTEVGRMASSAGSGSTDLVDISNIHRLGSSEADQVRTVVAAARQMLHIDSRLVDIGMEVDLADLLMPS